MSITTADDAIRAYQKRFPPVRDFSCGNCCGHSCIWLNFDCGGSRDNEGKAWLVMVGLIAAFSSLVFTLLSVKSFADGCKHELSARNIDAQDPNKQEIRAVFSYLKRESIFSGTSFLVLGSGSALLVAAIAFAIMKRGPLIPTAAAGGAGLAAGGAGFIVKDVVINSSGADRAYDRLRRPRSMSGLSSDEHIRRAYRRPQQAVVSEDLLQSSPPPYRPTLSSTKPSAPPEEPLPAYPEAPPPYTP